MIVTKILYTTINLFDSIDTYSPAIDKLLIQKLKERYVKKCAFDMYITDIVRIIRRSDVILMDNMLNGAAYVDVQFEAIGIILIEGEILHGCKVIKITATGILVSGDFISGQVVHDTKNRGIQSAKRDQIFSLIKKDQIIPVVVKQVGYNVGNSQIVVHCIPYIPAGTTEPFYNISRKLSADEKSRIDVMMNDLKEEIEKHTALKGTKVYEFFKNMMYPYKTQQKFELSKVGSEFKQINLDKLLDVEKGCITAPEVQYSDRNPVWLSPTAITIKDEEEFIKTVKVFDSTLYAALADIINKRLMFYRALRGFVEQYSDIAVFGDLTVYWQKCISLKE